MSDSYRQILRSSSIIGAASGVKIFVGLLFYKLAAVLLGPGGLGLLGLLQSLMNTASAVASMGFGNVGTRQIAEAVGANDPKAILAARRALAWGMLGLSALGATIFWILRHVIADEILKDARLSDTVGWLSIGVALTVSSGSQGALLNGLRRIGDMAKISILSTLLSTGLGIVALWLWGESGVLLFVLLVPFASFLFGHWFVSRLPKVTGPRTPVRQLLEQWKTLLRLGAAFMVAGLAVTIGQLVVRTMVKSELGTQALGQFQAAWMISMTYIGFVLQAMGADYYPRLTAAISDHAAVNRLVNEQSEVALWLAGPAFIAVLGLAPWIVEILYSSEFAQAAAILRWQILGDILKVASWPLGFIILAAGKGRTFMLFESFAIVIFAALTWLGLKLVGIQATGIAFLGMYVVCLPIVYLLARRRTGFSWSRGVYLQLLTLILVASAVFLAGLWSKWFGAVLGIGASIALALFALAKLAHIADLGGHIGRVAALARRVFIKAGAWRG